jgi:hypothetical protein
VNGKRAEGRVSRMAGERYLVGARSILAVQFDPTVTMHVSFWAENRPKQLDGPCFIPSLLNIFFFLFHFIAPL